MLCELELADFAFPSASSPTGPAAAAAASPVAQASHDDAAPSRDAAAGSAAAAELARMPSVVAAAVAAAAASANEDDDDDALICVLPPLPLDWTAEVERLNAERMRAERDRPPMGYVPDYGGVADRGLYMPLAQVHYAPAAGNLYQLHPDQRYAYPARYVALENR
jgi:hypothetical protein